MTKGLFFVSIAVLLSACMPAKEYQVVREQQATTTPVVINGIPAGYTPANPYAAVQSPYEYVPQATEIVPYYPLQPEMTPYVAVDSSVYEPTGTYAESAYLMTSKTVYPPEPTNVVLADQPVYSVQVDTMPTEASLQEIDTTETSDFSATFETENTQPDTNVNPLLTIVLQHPEHRDLVKCSANDEACLSSYTQKGYIRLRNAPRFAGHKEVTSETDYPPRKWRDNNNIPRW